MDEATVQKTFLEYLQYHNLEKTLKAFEEEYKLPNKKYKEEDLPTMPKIYSYMKGANAIAAREALRDKQYKLIEKNYSIILQTGKQLMALAIDSIQKLEKSGYKDSISVMKEQLSRYNQIFSTESRIEEKDSMDAFGDNDLKALKTKLHVALKSKDTSSIKESLTHLRKACLTTSAKNRRRVVEQLIKNDIFSGNIIPLLKLSNETRLNILAILCIYVSIPKGVLSILKQNSQPLISYLLETITQENPGSVCQRFSLGSLQKISIWNEPSSSLLIDGGLIHWILKEILERNILYNEYMHPYCMDFGSALIANLIGSHYGLVYFETRQSETEDMMNSMLEMIKGDNVSSCVLIHLLIALTSLANDRFVAILDNTQFNERISEFVEFYSVKSGEQENESPESRKIILDMCAHLFHPRENAANLDTSEVMEFNVRKHQEEVKEIEKKLDDENELLVFECFPDEVIANM
ncbi:hypothetical protein SteCoe_24205 [Stentor coeruleus]|uniref:Uncharacterized protein n=1 Tax=Stentor coeruleus TaxID=5963 RepID=A0A1R2BI58_9CILI|nr:hypothetical protein SteCoe_24205 [Stentor coeruleus]